MSNKNYILLVDTDSNYVDVSDIILHRYDSIDLNDEDQVLPKIRDIAKELEDELNNWYESEFTYEHFNTTNNKLNIKSETIGKSLYISAKKQYAQLILEREGVKLSGEDRFQMKGLDFLKSNVAIIYKDFGKDLIRSILLGSTKKDIDKKILDFREKFKQLPLIDVCKPTGISKYKEYIKRSPRSGDIFTELLPKCPINTKAAIYYNDLLRFKQLDKKYSIIQIGDKMLWMALGKNPYNIEVLGFPRYEPCPEIIEYIETYMDKENMFTRSIKEKVQKIYDNLQWGPINFNSHVASKVKYRK